MCLGMDPNIYHLIYFAEYPFELWKNLDKAFGLQEIEDEAWSEPSIYSCSLSLSISWPLHSLMKLIMMNNFLLQFMLQRVSPSLFCGLQRVSPRAYQKLQYGFKISSTISFQLC